MAIDIFTAAFVLALVSEIADKTQLVILGLGLCQPLIIAKVFSSVDMEDTYSITLFCALISLTMFVQKIVGFLSGANHELLFGKVNIGVVLSILSQFSENPRRQL